MSQAAQGIAVNRSRLPALVVGAAGVVFGDIGTSPLYAFKELFDPEYGIALNRENILGGLSLFFWSLVLVVSIKYVGFIMRAHNHGEGGIMALIALARPIGQQYPRVKWALLVLGIFGASLFYGDGIITPAISVLSAVEGLEVVSPALKHYVVPLSLLVLVILFIVQRWGTGKIGGLFGPIMIVWFVVLAIQGVVQIITAPMILSALDPRYGLEFFANNRSAGFLALGAVVLAITGAEALYADIGHFSRKAIGIAWSFLALPALTLNYFGQGALVLANPGALENPFYLLAPEWALVPMILLATAATVIASEAVISGTYSITHEAIQLGYLPRMRIVHTSSREIGQIYIPFVTLLLALGVAALVVGMKSASNLAAAYGIAVTGTMAADTILASMVAYALWQKSIWQVGSVGIVFLTVDLAFFSANLPKIPSGGWIPLVTGIILFTILTTWKRGRQLLIARQRVENLPLEPFLKSLLASSPARVPGTAVYMNVNTQTVPHALLHNLAHNKILHERLVFLTVATEGVPYVPDSERVEIHMLAPNTYQLLIRYGFQDNPDIPYALALCEKQGLIFNLMEVSFFLSRETLIPSQLPGMALWRDRLFALMSRNATSAMEFFKIPPNRVIELGAQVEI